MSRIPIVFQNNIDGNISNSIDLIALLEYLIEISPTCRMSGDEAIAVFLTNQ